MIGFYLQHKNDFADRARYTLRTLCRMMGFEYTELNDLNSGTENVSLVMVYGTEMPNNQTDKPLLFIAQENYQQAESLTQNDVRYIQSVEDSTNHIPYLFSLAQKPFEKVLYSDITSNEPKISLESKKASCSIDVVATVFYLLSLHNEQRATERDHFDRFQRHFSPIGEEIYETPVVDRWVNVLRDLILQLSPQMPIKPRWPHNAPFAVALSHDVDRIRTWTFRKARRALRGSHSQKSVLSRVSALMKSVTFPENWLGNFNFISQLEKKFDVASTFFLVSKHRHELDPTYKLASHRIREGLSLVKSRGGSVGLHGSIPSAAAPGYLAAEKNDMDFFNEHEVLGGRQHYLCFNERTPELWQEAGLKYDSTLGFSYDTGYRCGTSLPFYVLEGSNELPILEIPLILMDTVLFLESKQFLSAAEAWNVIETHLEETKRNGGLLTLNWHNSDLHPYDVYGYSQLYVRLLQWTQERGGWLASTDQVYDWWSST